MAINPSEKDVVCPCTYKLEDAIYTLGKPVSSENGMLHVPAQSAGFIKVDIPQTDISIAR